MTVSLRDPIDMMRAVFALACMYSRSFVSRHDIYAYDSHFIHGVV